MTDRLWIALLNMSLVASYCVLGVLLVRLALKRAPKIFSYCLWFLVLFRLLCPISLGSAFSLLPMKQAAIPQDIVYQAIPAVDTGISGIDQAINNSLPAATPEASINPLQIWLLVGEIGWLLGFSALLLYGISSYLRLKYRLREATLLEANIFECDRISSPFVLGFFSPKIYLPKGLEQRELAAILLHERTHIRRKDHWVKSLAFFALCLHWFNPLVWLSFALMTKDMELSCDESVMGQAIGDIRGSYSRSLLAVSSRNSGLFTPLAFGENNVKSRIKNVLRYRKPMVWVTIICVIVLAVVAVAFGTNPSVARQPEEGSGLSEADGVDAEDVRSELTRMTDIWAKALQTREGEPRYDMMSERAKEKFIAGQKGRVGGEDWNFNIGGSSPHIDSWDIAIDLPRQRATVLYHTSSGGETFEWKELVDFGQVDGVWKVIDYMDLGIEEMVSYYASSAEQAAASYIEGLKNSDYHQIAMSTYGAPYTWEGQEIWQTVNISAVTVVKTDIREEKACYELNLQVDQPGDSAFNQGENPRWLWLVKEEFGWTVEGLMSSGAPEDGWWQAPTISQQIAALLETIMASPKASSNPGDYTAAHEAEFRQLVAMGHRNLTLYYNSMDGDQQNGLAGKILEFALALQSNIGSTPEGTGE